MERWSLSRRSTAILADLCFNKSNPGRLPFGCVNRQSIDFVVIDKTGAGVLVLMQLVQSAPDVTRILHAFSEGTISPYMN